MEEESGKKEVNVRVPSDLVEEAEQLRRTLELAGRPVGSRSSLVRLALRKGLELLRAEIPAPAPASPRPKGSRKD